MPTEHSEILQLLHDMENKLTAAIATGLQSVNLAIATLSDHHNKALLDQEKRNSSFADRDRVEAIAANTHANANHLTALQLRVGQLERKADSLDARFDARCREIDDRLAGALQDEASHTVGLLAGANGYLVMLAIMLASNLLTFLLAHAVH